MRSALGPVLRMLGLLIEAACLVPLLATRGQGRMVGGLRLESLLYVGLAVGFAVWAAGMIVGQAAPRRPRDPRSQTDRTD